MKRRTVRIVNLVLALVVALFVTGYTFAWFANSKNQTITFGAGSNDAYFAGGNGTEQDPYLIAEAQHMYNLAWLQNTGKLNDSKLFFALSGDVTMTTNGKAVILPPIGNDDYPFIGEFDGKGYTISQLIISTNKNVLTNVPKVVQSNDYKFSNAVGFFGMTGANSDVKNFILNDPVVEVATENALYSDKSSATVGLAIGYVENKASSIGVYGGKLAIRKTGYKTVNSIIGCMSTAAEGSNNLTGSASSSGNGGSEGYFIADNLEQAAKNDYAGSKYLFKNYDSSNYNMFANRWLVSSNGIVEGKNRWAKELTSDYFDYSSKNNLGLGVFSFITGHGNKDSSAAGDISIRSSSPIKNSSNQLYDANNNYAITDNSSWGQLVFDKNGNNYVGYSFEYSFRYRKASSTLEGNTLSLITEASSDSFEKVVNSSGDQAQVVTSTTLSYANLPVNALLFNIVENDANMYAIFNNKADLYLTKILDETTLIHRLRFKAAQADGKYSGYKKYEDCDTETKNSIDTTYSYVDGSYFFFKYDYDLLYSTDKIVYTTSDTQTANVITLSRVPNTSTSGKWIGYNVSLNSTVNADGSYEEDKRGIYALTSLSEGVDIHYVSATGVSGGDSGSDTADTTKKVSAIDFIYKGVKIVQTTNISEKITVGSFYVTSTSDGSTTYSLYTETGKQVNFGTTSTESTLEAMWFFYRDTDTILKLAYVAGTAQPKASGITAVSDNISNITLTTENGLTNNNTGNWGTLTDWP
jgi:hypothetical protein